MRVAHRVHSEATPAQVWALVAAPRRWAEVDVRVARTYGASARVSEGQRLLVVTRWSLLRVPVDVRVVEPGRRLGLTAHTVPGVRELLDLHLVAAARGGTDITVIAVGQGVLAPFLLAPLWVSAGLVARLVAMRAGATGPTVDEVATGEVS